MQQPPDQPQYPQQPQYPSQYPQQPQYPQQQPYPNEAGWQQPPYQQQPYPYGMQQQPPEKKRGRGCLIGGIIAVVVVIALIAAVAAANGGKGGTATNSPTQQASNDQTPQATATTAAPTTHKVGESQTIGNWKVKLNSVKTSTGGTIMQPKSGNIFVIINVTANNTIGSAQNISSALSFKVTDSTGQAYTETIVDNQKAPPDGRVAANGKVTGEIAYEVPTSEKQFTLAFIPDFTGTDQVTWTFTVS